MRYSGILRGLMVGSLAMMLAACAEMPESMHLSEGSKDAGADSAQRENEEVSVQNRAGSLTGMISGSGGIVKSGAGSFTLNGGTSGYSGGTTVVSGGTLAVGSTDAMGNGQVALAEVRHRVRRRRRMLSGS